VGYGDYYICRNCSYFGPEYVDTSNKRFSKDPDLRKQILSGSYGDRPKELIISSPDAEYQLKGFLYLCRNCGEMSSESGVIIKAGNKELYRPAKNCRICGKKMKEINSGENVKCPKCGKTLIIEDSRLWD